MHKKKMMSQNSVVEVSNNISVVFNDYYKYSMFIQWTEK